MPGTHKSLDSTEWAGAHSASQLDVMQKKELIAKIMNAFADTPSPGKKYDDIVAVKYWDEGAAEYFSGKTWQGHSVRDLRNHVAAISYFTDKAFRYWIPAFMIAELEDPETADVIGEYLASTFYETPEEENKRVSKFSRTELEAIASFFEWCADQLDDEIGEFRFAKVAKAVRDRITPA